jgi:hypothetical protein
MTNKVAHQLFGYTKTELRGKNISMLLPPMIAEQHTGYIRNYINTGTRLHAWLPVRIIIIKQCALWFTAWLIGCSWNRLFNF